MSQQQDPLPIEVDSSAGGWSWQTELTYPQITPHHQEALPMSIVPFRGDGGGEDDEEDMISRLRSGPLLSPPRWLGPFSSASPPDISVALWDRNTWSPPRAAQLPIDLRAAVEDLFNSVARNWIKLIEEMSLTLEFLGLLKRLVGSGMLEAEYKLFSRVMTIKARETDYTFRLVTFLLVHPRDPYGYGTGELLLHHFTKDGELEYCIYCNQVFPSDTRFSDLQYHLSSHRILFAVADQGSLLAEALSFENKRPKGLVVGRLWEGCESASEEARGNGEPIEINPEKSGSGHVESPLAFDQSNTHPETMRLDNGKDVGSTDIVQNFFEETTKADKPSKTKWSGVWEHFVEIRIDDKVWAECKHCNKRLKADSKKGGTSSLHRHAKLHGINIDKASSSKNEKNLCGGPATSKSKTPTPSLRPPLAPQTKKTRTDGTLDVATQEVSAGGKRTRHGDNPSCGVQFTCSRTLNQEANQEATQDFSITKCIASLRTLEEFDPAEKAKAFVVFKSVENREIFLSAVDEKDGSALIWLRSEIDKLT